jgi:hypothetical protein
MGGRIKLESVAEFVGMRSQRSEVGNDSSYLRLSYVGTLLIKRMRVGRSRIASYCLSTSAKVRPPRCKRG